MRGRVEGGNNSGGAAITTTAGTVVMVNDTRVVSAGSLLQETSNYTEKLAYNIKLKGVIRVSFDFKAGTTNQPVHARIYINNVAVGTDRLRGQSTYATFIEDFNVNPGDRISLYLMGYTPDGDVYYAAYATNFKIMVGDGIMPTLAL